MDNDKIIDLILVGIFRDGGFHLLADNRGKEFYIEILDEMLLKDIELDELLNNEIKDLDESITKIKEISKPYLKRISDEIEKLTKDNWFKVKKVNFEVLQKDEIEKSRFRGKIIPAGKLLSVIIKITATQINWGKFIEKVADTYEKINLDWDNVYSDRKQNYIIIHKINERAKSLDRDENIIFKLDKYNADLGRVKIFKTLNRLEKEGFILIDGFTIYDPNSKFIIYNDDASHCLKAIISLTKKFIDRIKKEMSEAPKSKNIITRTILKDARLDQENHLLEINKGEKIISFKSKKKGEGFKKGTKQFKILYHLWDFRRELKNTKVLEKGNFVSLDNLARGSSVKSQEATYQHIKRINSRFNKEGVSIKIEGENGKYILVINKS